MKKEKGSKDNSWDMMNSFEKGLIVGVIFLTLLLSNPGFAYSVEHGDNIYFADGPVPELFGETPPTEGAGDTIPLGDGTPDSGTPLDTGAGSNPIIPGEGFSCNITSLTPKEANAIMDLTHDNFQGKEISDGKDLNANGTDITGVELVGKDNDGKTAVKQTPPSKAADADRFAYFNNRNIPGPIGIGMILDDTLRVGRCEDLSQEQCRINGNGLNYRTSGTTNFGSVLVDASGTLKDLATRGITGTTEEELQAMQNQLVDVNDAKVKLVQLSEGDQIKNSFLTEQYTARNATTCNNNACMVSTYSAFDKFFNEWFSSDMVISVFGPTLLNGAAKKLGLFGHGPSGGSKLLKNLNKKVEGLRSNISALPSALVGKRRVDSYQTLVKENGFGDLWKKLTIESKAFSSGAGGYTDEILKEGSDLMKLSPQKREAFFESLQHMKAYSNASADAMKRSVKDFDDALAVAVTQAQRDQALLAHAKRVSAQITDWDDAVFLDFPAWIKNNQDMSALSGYAVKRNQISGSNAFVELSTGETHYFTKGVLKPFQESGDWSRYASGSLGSSSYNYDIGTQGLKLYRLKPSKQVASNVAVADLEEYLAKFGENFYSVDIPGRGLMPLNSSSVGVIKSNPAVLPNVKVFEADWAFDKELNPVEFAGIITQPRIISRPNTAAINFNDLDVALRQDPTFVNRRVVSGLDEWFSKEKTLLKDYYKLDVKSAGFYKAFFGPYAYWNVKRGLGSEQFSAYMLPDTWTTLTVSQGTDAIYNDSYIDFYANEGSDQGDLFGKMINSIVFTPNYVAKEIISKVAPSVEDKLRQFTGEGGVGSKSLMRDEVKDIAFYSHNENCSGCQTNFVSDGEYLGATISAPVSLKSFIVEAADSVTKAEEGTTLIAYTHHSNLDGKTPDIEGEEMNLVEGRRDGLTCDQKLREYHVGWAGSASGGISAGLENLAYLANPGFGLIASGIQQVVLTPALQDCVDDKEGYYVHFYAPPEPEQKKTKSKETLSNETVTDALAGISEQVDKLTSQEGPIAESLGNIKDEFDNFAGQAKQNDLLQASLEMLPPSKGTIIGNEIFYIWFKETMMPSGLKTEGMSVTKDGNHTVVKDYANGDLLIDGKEVINNKKEIVGNIIQDNRIPAEVVPVKVTNIGAPQTDEIVFELSATGNVTVLESQVLSCIQEAVKAQVGITFSGNELTQVFGKLNNINTEIYQQVTAQDNKIFLEGTGPRYQGGATSTFVIDGYWKSRLNIDDTQSIDSGLFIGMSFEYGSIVLNEETGEIVVWLRQHKESVLSNKEVSGLKAKLSSVTDPDSGCEQPAIELEASAFANDELGQQRVDNFNTSMKHLGPFTQFTTDGKIYEFYSVRDPATGECKDFFRVIDKETGKVLTDSEIVGGITQDADGTLTFKTADGKTHTLDFDAENGVPKLSYNGGPAETLRTAQGPNGSFWYDPNTGRWYPENGMQIPLNQAFKDQGSSYKVDGNGNVTGTPGNPMTFNIGQGAQGGFNIPSLPETMSGLVLFIMAFLTMAFVITRRKRFEITK